MHDAVNLVMRQRAAFTQYSVPRNYFDNAVAAANRGTEYWNNVINYVNPLIENQLISRISQTVPIAQATIDAVVRPKDVAEKKARIDAYVRQIRGEPEPDDQQLVSSSSVVESLPRPATAALVEGIDNHLDEDDDANVGAIVAVIIGSLVMFILIGMMVRRFMMMKAMGGSSMGGGASGAKKQGGAILV